MEFQTGGGGGTLKKLGKNKMFLIAAAGVAVLGLFVMLRKGSSSASSEENVTMAADGYPSPYNGVDTAAQMQNMQSILEGQAEANNNAMYAGFMSELNQTKADMKEEYEAKLAEKEAAISKAADKKIQSAVGTKSTITTDSFNQEWKASAVYKELLATGAKDARVSKTASGGWKVTASYVNPSTADASAQTAVKNLATKDKRIGFKNYDKATVK